jgi:hypothetical protein
MFVVVREVKLSLWRKVLMSLVGMAMAACTTPTCCGNTVP